MYATSIKTLEQQPQTKQNKELTHPVKKKEKKKREPLKYTKTLKWRNQSRPQPRQSINLEAKELESAGLAAASPVLGGMQMVDPSAPSSLALLHSFRNLSNAVFTYSAPCATVISAICSGGKSASLRLSPHRTAANCTRSSWKSHSIAASFASASRSFDGSPRVTVVVDMVRFN